LRIRDSDCGSGENEVRTCGGARDGGGQHRGDYLWRNVLPHGRPAYWFAHAIVLFSTGRRVSGMAVAQAADRCDPALR